MPVRQPSCDAQVAVIGGGILGLATARALIERDPQCEVVVLEKESVVASHQSGRNSGVIHSGIYYKPGSQKALLVKEGVPLLRRFADKHGIVHEICGKLIVATKPADIEPLRELQHRADAHGLSVTLLSRAEMQRREPHVEGLAGLLVPETGIIDFGIVCDALAEDLRASGRVEIRLGVEVDGIESTDDEVRIATRNHPGRDPIRTESLVNCAGLHADVVARMCGQKPSVSMLAFRGEYVSLVPSATSLVRHLIYPVPDPRFPFLGVHFTRGVDGSVHAGPNAVAALAREGYDWRTIDPAYIRDLTHRSDAQHLARRYWRTGLGEVVRSLSLRRLVSAMQRLIPEITISDVLRSGSGVRAQAIRPDGTLVDDFVFERTGRVLSVLNAPSPAATASLAIGKVIAGQLDLTSMR